MRNKIQSFDATAGMIGLSGVVLFSAKSVFAKMAYEYRIDPISVLYLRMLFSFPLLLTVIFVYEKTRKHAWAHWQDIAKVIVISILGYYISAVFNFVGLLYIDASIERLILFLYPTMVIILSAIFLNKRVSTKQIIAILIAYLGIIIAFAEKLKMNSEHNLWLGVSLVFVSSLTYAIFLTVSDNLIQKVGSFRFTSIATLTMAICMIIHALSVGKAQIEGYNHHVYFYCILMAVLSTVLPLYLFNYSISRLGAANVSIISCMGPVITLLLSAVLLSETITLWQLAGTMVVMGGILIIHLNYSSRIWLKIRILSRNLNIRKAKSETKNERHWTNNLKDMPYK
jgi:RarD protein